MIVALHRNLSSIGCTPGRLGFSPHITTQAVARDDGYTESILARSLQALQTASYRTLRPFVLDVVRALMLLFMLPTLSIHKHGKIFRYSARAVFDADHELTIPPSTLAEYI